MPELKTVYPLNDGTEHNFNYAHDKIEFTPAGAQLKLIDNPSQLFSQSFGVDTGFTYDSALTEFVAGQCQQKDQAPANAVCWATYTAITDLNYIASGDSTATITGSPIVEDNQFKCYGGLDENAIYNNANIATIQDTFSVKKKWTAGYAGSPAANTNIFQFSDATNNNKFVFFHSAAGGTLRVSVWDSAGTQIHSAVIIDAAFSPVLGTPYEFSVNATASTGIIEIYIDGIYKGATPIIPFTRTGTNFFYLGSGTTYPVADGAYQDLILYNTVQHSGGAGGNYTPGYSLPEAKYVEDLITLPVFTYADLGSIQSFDNFVTFQTGLVRMNLNGEYWTGSAWAASDDSYAQMNDPATLTANIGSLPASDTVSIKMRTQNSSTQMSITLLTITYTGQAYPTDNPTIEVKTGIPVDAIYSWNEDDVTVPAGTGLKYILVRNPALWYAPPWDPTNETYSESNFHIVIAANLDTLDLSSGNTAKFLAFLNSDGTDTPILTQVSVEYDFHDVTPLPNHAVVYGQVISMVPELLEGATISVNSYKRFMHGNNSVMLRTTATTDENGDFEMEVIETETVNILTFVQIVYKTAAETITVIYDDVIIPNVESVSLETLLAGKSPRH